MQNAKAKFKMQNAKFKRQNAKIKIQNAEVKNRNPKFLFPPSYLLPHNETPLFHGIKSS